jgi:hypothetical protein
MAYDALRTIMPIAGLRQVREGSLQTNASTRCPAGAVEDRFQYRSRFRFICDSLLEGEGFEPSVPQGCVPVCCGWRR